MMRLQSATVVFVIFIFAPKLPAESAGAKPPRSLEIFDAKDWKRIAGFTLSKDGKWCGFFEKPTEGDGTIVIKEVKGETKHTFKVGPNSGSIAFSHNSRWAAFRSAPLEKAEKAAKKAKKPAPNKVVLIKLKDGGKTEFDKAATFAFSGEASKWLAVKKSRPEGRPSGDKGWGGTDLILHELSNGKQLNLGNVGSFGFNKSGKRLAVTIDAEGKSGNGVHLMDMANNRLSVLESDKAVFKSLAWTKEGDAFALLKEIVSEKHEEKLHHVLAFHDFTGDGPEKIVVDPTKDAGIPENMTISPNRPPNWTKNRDGILFGIHDAKPKKEEEKTEAKKEGEEGATNAESKKTDGEKPSGVEEADVVIWHWKDKRLQSRQQVQETQDKRFNYVCLYRLEDKKTLRLANEEMRRIRISRPERFALAIDNSKYELSANLNGRRLQDVYVIDLKTGKRRLALKKNRWLFDISPNGDQFLFFHKSHFHVYNMVTGKSRNITENAPVSFVDVENDRNIKDPPTRPFGWTTDGRVLLSDKWDFWLMPTTVGDAVNLTKNGKKKGIRYQWRYRLDPDEEGIDLSKPVYVGIYGEWTKKGGIGRIDDGEPGVKMLLWDDASFGSLRKVKDREIYYYTRETQKASPDHHVAGPDLDKAKKVTDANPQQKNFHWTAGGKLIDYKSTNGDKLQAALLLPANYVEGKSYPAIVYIYEKLSQRLNTYNAPSTRGFSPAIYTSQGYAVLMPDIVYKLNQPGQSSVACVLPAVEAAIKTGIVDAKKIGLHGHSWGGYQTSFLITQTDTFKAAVAGAPLTNLISMYSSIYWNSGMPNQPIFESSQGRFTSGYWDNLEAYASNSPVYHAKNVKTPLLLLHNDKDGAVDWNQGIEYFNTLRRLRKPVVMLQYKGENHGLVKLPNRKDYSYRMLDFFNHHLKGKPAPKWWLEGVKHLDLKEHIKDHRESHTKSQKKK